MVKKMQKGNSTYPTRVHKKWRKEKLTINGDGRNWSLDISKFVKFSIKFIIYVKEALFSTKPKNITLTVCS